MRIRQRRRLWRRVCRFDLLSDDLCKCIIRRVRDGDLIVLALQWTCLRDMCVEIRMERGLKGWTTKAASSGARLIWAREFSPQPFTFTFGTSTFTSILSGLALHGDVAAYKTILAVDDGRTEATNARKQPARARGPRPATKCVRAPANTPSPLRISAVPLASQIRTGKRHTQKNACKQVR